MMIAFLRRASARRKREMNPCRDGVKQTCKDAARKNAAQENGVLQKIEIAIASSGAGVAPAPD